MQTQTKNKIKVNNKETVSGGQSLMQEKMQGSCFESPTLLPPFNSLQYFSGGA